MSFFWILTYSLYVSYCYCQVTYKLSIFGEAQYGYYVTMYLGTPPQRMNLLLDTGSSNVAVATVPPVTGSGKYFHTNESTTFYQLGTVVDLHYVIGQWSGFLAEDIINFDNGTIKCTFACMTSISEIFDPRSQFQGLLGLAYPSISLPDSSVQPFFDTLIKVQNVSNTFSIDLCGPYFTSKKQTTECGKFEMGSAFKTSNDRQIVYTPIVKEWYYEIILTDLKMGMNCVPVKCWELNRDRSIIDSGTTDLYMPKVVFDWTVREIRKHVQHIILDEFWINETAACVPYDIFDITIFPTLTLSFYHSMNSTFNILVTSELYLLPFDEQKSTFTCFKLAFSVLDYGVLIGSSILRGFYVVFDRQNKRIGFANSKNFNKTNGFPGTVMQPKYTHENVQSCKKEIASSSSNLSPVMIVVLFSAVIVTLVLLYMLVSWIFKHFLMRSGESSETSSLMESS